MLEVHGHKRLDNDATADSGINDRLVKLRPLIDQTCFELKELKCAVVCYFRVEYLTTQTY